MEEYNIYDDPELNRIITNNNLSPYTQNGYYDAAKQFSRINQKPYYKIVEEIKELQYDRIEENHIIRYNPNHSQINTYLNNFINHCFELGNKPSTIKSKNNQIRTILRKSGIILPKPPRIDRTYQRKKILTKKDIKYILEKSTIPQQALITFLASTGMRLYDALSLTIDDFIEATSDQHKYYNINDFLDNAPQDLLGYWVFTPNKTKKLGVECRVCNTPESSNHILLNLRERQRILEKKGLSIEHEDPLFSSRQQKYKRPIIKEGISSGFWKKNRILQQYKMKTLQNDLENNRITYKQYQKKIENLPKFHAHALRHFFTTTVRNYTTNRDISLIMEGHTSPFAMDKHYIGTSEELFNDETIKETYKTIIPYLTFNQEIDPLEYQELLLERKVNEELRNEQEKQRELLESIIKNSGIDKLL